MVLEIDASRCFLALLRYLCRRVLLCIEYWCAVVCVFVCACSVLRWTPVARAATVVPWIGVVCVTAVTVAVLWKFGWWFKCLWQWLDPRMPLWLLGSKFEWECVPLLPPCCPVRVWWCCRSNLAPRPPPVLLWTLTL